MSELWNLNKRRKAIDRYEGMDTDKDHLDDGMEVQSGLHDLHNKPLHTIHRAGPTTPGKAYAGGGSIQFEYDNSIVDLHVRPRKGSVGGKYSMPSPKTMKLTVSMGKNGDQSKYELNLDGLKPHKHTLDDSKIKIPTINFSLNRNKKVKK